MTGALGRRIAVAVSVPLIGLGLVACGSPETNAFNELRAAMARTDRLPRRFEYRELDLLENRETVVKGIVEDDFRYRARYEVNGKPVVDEVVRDDAVANRFASPGGITLLLRKTPATPADPIEGDATPAAVRDALKAGQWVLDVAGAPSKFAATAERRRVGDDPIYDAQTVFDYVESVGRTMPVRKFNADALDYKPKEDPFPRPARNSGIDRYDFVRLPVPRPADAASSGGNQPVPGPANFRKMAVYVQGGRVIRVLEQMDVASRLGDIERNYDIDLKGDTIARIRTAINAIDSVRKAQGQNEPVRVRTMELKLAGVGQKQTVELPEPALRGSLILLVNRGKVGTRAAGADTAATASTTEPSPTSTTEPPPSG